MRVMGLRARECAVREFGVSSMCTGYAAVYDKLVRMRR
jgi:hypothetical protein